MQLVAFAWGGTGLLIGLLLLSRFTLQLNAHDVACECTRGWWRLVIGLSVIATSIGYSLRAMTLLKDGVRNQRWLEKELEPVRTLVSRPIWNVLMWVQVVAGLAYWIFGPKHNVLALYYWFAYIPLQVPQQMRLALRKPRVPVTIDWKAFKPMQSEHWGAPKAG
jgi:hypothetical protein